MLRHLFITNVNGRIHKVNIVIQKIKPALYPSLLLMIKPPPNSIVAESLRLAIFNIKHDNSYDNPQSQGNKSRLDGEDH